jgi:hypothetical protein
MHALLRFDSLVDSGCGEGKKTFFIPLIRKGTIMGFFSD